MMNHTPLINPNASSCSCGRWGGPLRRFAEPIGQFTLRAHEAHQDHVERRKAAAMNEQVELFDQQIELFSEAK